MPNKNGFSYHVQHRGELFFICCNDHDHELCPWFESNSTALEMALKVSRGDEFCDGIPCVPIGSPVPRPRELVWVATKAKPTRPQPSNGTLTPAQRERRGRG